MSKKIIYELSTEELIKLASKSIPKEKEETKVTEAASFIYALNLRHGDVRIPVQLIYYTYKQWKGWDNKPQPKPYFFRDFSKYFEQARTKDGMTYLLDPKPFDLSKETYFIVRKEIRDSRAKKTKKV